MSQGQPGLQNEEIEILRSGFFLFSETGSSYALQTDFQLMTISSKPPKSWDYWDVLPQPTSVLHSCSSYKSKSSELGSEVRRKDSWDILSRETEFTVDVGQRARAGATLQNACLRLSDFLCGDEHHDPN